MEKIELQKRLEKKKAYLVCAMLFLVLVIPTLLGLFRDLDLSLNTQVMILSGILMIIVYIYKKMSEIRTQIRTLLR